MYYFQKFLIEPNSYFMQALASTLDEDELANLRDQFQAIDVDKSGSISLDEMRQVNIPETLCFIKL